MDTAKEETGHLQQLVRDLVISDIGGSSAPPSFGSSTTGASSSTSAVGTRTGTDTTAPATSSSSANNENFDQIAYTIKQIFQTGKEDAFADQLTAFVTKKEGDIEKMCSLHYQEFVQAVDQLLKVRAGTVTLRNKIVELNDEMRAAASKIIDRKKEIIEFRRMLVNIETAVEVLQTCLFVLDIHKKINTHIENNKFYQALRVMDELQSHLKYVSNYGFAKHMQECIPRLREKIKDSVSAEMKEWFVKVRESTRKVGKLALENTALKQEQVRKSKRKSGGWVQQQQNGRGRGGGDAGAGARMALSSVNMITSMEIALNEENEEDALDNAQVRLDFRPLYQCLHIFDVLGNRDEFKMIYEENRRLQANLVLSSSFSFSEGNLSGFENYLHDIVGFFIIEAVVMNSTQNFRSRGSVETLWETATDQINKVISSSLQDCADPDLFLTIKLLVVIFIQTLEGYGYAVSKLSDLMVSLLDQYAELMKSKFSDRIVEVIENDEYAPMLVENAKQYEQMLSAFAYTPDPAEDPKAYPKQMPFSRGFPVCCEYVKKFITGFYRFAEGFSQQNNEIDDLLKKSLENLLIQSLNSALVRRLLVNNTSQAVQIMVNLEYFEKACAEFEAVVMEKRSAENARVVLQAAQTFRDARMQGEKRLIELTNTKVDEFLELADYQWISPNPPVVPSLYVQELTNFLTSVSASTLSSLPDSVRNAIYHAAFEHLASTLQDMLLSPSVKKINGNFVDQLNLDVGYLGQFIADLKTVKTGLLFEELRQLAAFLKSDNYEEFLGPTKQTKYPRVKATTVVVILEKLKGEAGGVFSSKGTASEKAKRKSIEGLLKTLKTMKE
ncbi:hypothetical protein HK102_013250 [Quaeritorhiza haematococci]|nr:hypothetical protein HK102_013250 [Quaeritorhiza haematococci]